MSLEKIFKPKRNYELFRYGKNNDGGYLIGNKTLKKTNNLISIGINDDWSFEYDIKNNFPEIKIFCFDDILDKKYLIKRVINQLIFIIFNWNLSLLTKYICDLNKFKFFKKKTVLLKKIRIFDKLKIISNSKLNNILLKIDIEGSEYRILKDIIKYQKKLNGLIIEFHDIDLHKEKIKRFIEKLDMKITHIHPNNFGQIDKNKNPVVIELTFERYPVVIGKELMIPNKMDMKNDKYSKDIKLYFKR